MKDRIYVCHTFYHVYIACLKELARRRDQASTEGSEGATLVLSTMSNDFASLPKRAKECPLWDEVLLFEEKEDVYFPKLMELKKDRGNLVANMWQRMRFCKELSRAEEPFVPVDFTKYRDIYVFCDSDPIGYYLNGHHIRYHALEDGLDCIRYYDTARYDNRGHFRIKAAMAALGLIFIQNGYAKYCIDMEVNDISVLPYPCRKYIECRREELTASLTPQDQQLLVRLFIENLDALQETIRSAATDATTAGTTANDEVLAPKPTKTTAGTTVADTSPVMLVLTEPLCDLETRKRLFKDLIAENQMIEGMKARVVLKPHPRDLLNYREEFPDCLVLDASFPMEILNYVEGISFDRVVTVYTVPSSLKCVKESIYLGDDFMDRYEAPEIHRQNEQI